MTPALVRPVVAEDIHAAEAVSAYRASIVDGYVVTVPPKDSKAISIKGTFPVASVSHTQAYSSMEYTVGTQVG